MSQKNSYSGIIPFAYGDKEEIHKFLQYEVSMSDYMGNIAKKSTKMAAI